MGNGSDGMGDTKRTLSWPAIIGIWVAAIATSLAASYRRAKVPARQTEPRAQVSVLVAATVPLSVPDQPAPQVLTAKADR